MSKKIVLSVLTACILSVNAVFANNFDSLEGLSPLQKQKMTNVYNAYKVKNNEIETRILSYQDKIAAVKNDKDKTQDQIDIVVNAYERNIKTLVNQQQILAKDADLKYKSILTQDQYKQYQDLQVKVQDSFEKFLEK